jgi:hypothetical protein
MGAHRSCGQYVYLFFILFIFVIVVVKWGPIACCIQVCVIFIYFILDHSWLPRLSF